MKKFSVIAFLALLFTFVACDSGLGNVVDIEAPEVTVSKMVCEYYDESHEKQEAINTVFGTTIFTKKNVTFYGSATDNTGITNVRAEVKWNGDSDYKPLGNAELYGEEWKLDVSFEDEGTCWVRIVAEDRKANYGNKSAKVIPLFVDETAPVGTGWYIDRGINGIRYNLQSKEFLVNLLANDTNLTDPANKDVAQNGSFYICATFSDASGIKDGTTISLYDVHGNKVGPIQMVSGSTKTSPRFLIDSTKLNAYSTGIHYFQVKYSSKDIVTVPSSNEVEDQEISGGWFIWYPESDNPRCSVTGLGNRTEMNVHTSESINITVFDDDSLNGKVIVKLTDASGNPVYNSDGSSIPNETYPKNGGDIVGEIRDVNITIKAPDLPQTVYLTITAKDKYNKALSFAKTTVHVADDFVPTLILTSPENNQIPEVSGTKANINFSGVTLDKSGCKYVDFVWVPDSVKTNVQDKKTLAQNLLNTISSDDSIHATYLPSGSQSVKVTTFTASEYYGAYNGVKLWTAKLSSGTMDSGFKKQSFNFNISLLNDFNNEKTVEKYIFARVTREDGNKSDSEIKLAADNVKPEIVAISPSGNMAIIDSSSGLTIKFKAVKSNGLLMDKTGYKIEYYPYNDQETLTELAIDHYELNDVTVTDITSPDTVAVAYVSKQAIEGYDAARINPTVILHAKDVLGNENTKEFQAVISELPSLKAITSSAPEKCKIGDEILINASFSKTATCTTDTKLKLKNITNGGVSVQRYATYVSGSGSTTLVFKYTVQEGDESNELQVDNVSGVGPFINIISDGIKLDTLTAANNLQGKRASNPIKIDGIAPKVSAVSSISITSDAQTENNVSGITYLKSGRTIIASVTVSEPVTVQGIPSFKLGDMILTWESITNNGKTLNFSKKILDGDTNGIISYGKTGYIINADVIKDDYGNSLLTNLGSDSQSTTFFVQTNTTGAPVITIKDKDGKAISGSGKFMNSVSFEMTKATNTVSQYSLDGGTTWNNYSSKVTLNTDATLVGRYKDYAGNISSLTTPVELSINSTFPDFTLECTNSDGKYKQGSKIYFKVSFTSNVNISANSDAYIVLSGVNVSDTVTSGAKARLSEKTAKNGVTEAIFEYSPQPADNFTLKVLKENVVLTGIKDEYGIIQGSKKLTSDYVRNNVRIDCIAPTITSMTPQGTKSSQNGQNAYTNGKQIKLVFNENVKAVTGRIYLRQTEGWAIPPMFTAKEFNKVINAVKAASIDTSKTYGLTGTEVLYLDGLEDGENLFGSLPGIANDMYHGTAQYAGPYKKMTNGVNNDGTPDLSVKYVLDFGVDIWDSENSTTEYFGKTFEDHSNIDYKTYHHISETGHVNVVTPSNHITTDSIRYVLEQAGYHQRSVKVSSSYVKVLGNEVTINFPEGLLGDSDLPIGREWELVIEKGAFMDETGNYFGSDANGTIDKATEAFVLVQNEGNDSFMSYGVETPVIRVDRYSYGLGIKQPTGITNGKVDYEIINVKSVKSQTCIDGNGTNVPTAKVAVRIDCVTPGAKVRYTQKITEKVKGNANSTPTHTDGGANSYSTSTTYSFPANPSGTGSDNVIFIAGSGDYTKSCKQYIIADALYNGTSIISDKAKEGIFQTIVNIDKPKHNGGNNDLYNGGDGKQDVSIHGTTGFSGEPSIAPFPLRDQPVGSAYMRRTYQKGDQYYWISYEVLVDSCYSMYTFGKFAYNDMPNYAQHGIKNYANPWHDWAKNYGKINFGEFNYVTGMEGWPAKY